MKPNLNMGVFPSSLPAIASQLAQARRAGEALLKRSAPQAKRSFHEVLLNHPVPLAAEAGPSLTGMRRRMLPSPQSWTR